MEVEIYITGCLLDVGLTRSLQQRTKTESNIQKSFKLGSFTKGFKYFIARFGETTHFTTGLYSERAINQLGVTFFFSCCIEDPYKVRELSLTIAYNKSDVTFGWNGFNNALTLYYMSQMEEFVSKDHRNVDL